MPFAEFAEKVLGYPMPRHLVAVAEAIESAERRGQRLLIASSRRIGFATTLALVNKRREAPCETK